MCSTLHQHHLSLLCSPTYAVSLKPSDYHENDKVYGSVALRYARAPTKGAASRQQPGNNGSFARKIRFCASNMPKASSKLKNPSQDGREEARALTAATTNTSRPLQAPGYAEVQSDEVEVLKAIYADGFEEVETKAAWSKTHEKSFRLILASYSDAMVYMSLLVTLTATYPKTLPLLRIESSSNISGDVLQRLRELLVAKPQEMVGEVMIHEIATIVQDILEDAVTAAAQKETEKATVPSLEEERAVRETAAFREAAERQQALAREQQAAVAKKEQEQQAKIDEELKKREKERVKRRSNLQQDRQTDDDALSILPLDQVRIHLCFPFLSIVNRTRPCLMPRQRSYVEADRYSAHHIQ